MVGLPPRGGVDPGVGLQAPEEGIEILGEDQLVTGGARPPVSVHLLIGGIAGQEEDQRPVDEAGIAA